MRSLRNSKPSVDGAPVVVTAKTLKEAYKIVRDDYGEDAVILGTRTVNKRQELGLGHERQIEVTIQLPGDRPGPASLGRRGAGTAAPRPAAVVADNPSRPTSAVNQDIIREVNRIEELVASIAEDHNRLARQRLPFCDNTLAMTLIENGASPETVNTILTRFTTETGSAVTDRPAALAWLTENLRASNCTWEDFYGCHAFLGEAGSGCSDLVSAAAALLQGMGRHTLVLSLMPNSNTAIKRLQIEAAHHGFDAAVIRKESQLASADKHLANYDVVLVDMPNLQHEAMAEGGQVHDWLARNASFHRHLLIPLDKDPQDMGPLSAAARAWNCDWVAVTRTDLSTRTAKILDLLERVPIPVSLTSANPTHGGTLAIAQSDHILDGMLSGEAATGFVRSTPTSEGAATGEVDW